MSNDPSRVGDYQQARIGAAAALVVVVVFIIIGDVLMDDYEASPVIIASFLGTIAALVGVELKAFIQR